MFWFWGWCMMSQAGAPLLPQETPHTIRWHEDKLNQTRPPKKVVIIGKAYEALKLEKFAKALSLALSEPSTFYLDYEAWIASKSYHGQANELALQRKYDRAIVLIRKALDQLARIGEEFPYSPFLPKLTSEAAQIELSLGEIYYASKNKKALTTYEKAFQRLSNQSLTGLAKAAHLTHYAELCQRDRSLFCVTWLRKLSQQAKKRSLEVEAIRKGFPGFSDFIPAIRGSQGRLSQVYKSPDLDQQAFDAAFKLFMGGKDAEALEAFQKFLEQYPKSSHRFRARYWLAQALVRKKDLEKAKTLFIDLVKETPLSYYGLLASHSLGVSLRDIERSRFIVEALEWDPALSPSDQLHLERGKAFYSAKLPELSASELKEIKARENCSDSFLVYLAFLNQNARNYSLVFSYWNELAQRRYPGALSPKALQMMFPLEYEEVVGKYAKSLTVDPLLIFSLMKQESAFNEEAISSSGAVGLMQLMPGTALDTDLALKLDELPTPDRNVGIGTKYLKKLLDRFSGNIALSLAGYNAGPNAADRWIKSLSKPDLFEFIELIPYKETREYVSSIIRNYYWYSLRTGHLLPVNFGMFWKNSTSSNLSTQPAIEGSPPVIFPEEEEQPSPSPNP